MKHCLKLIATLCLASLMLSLLAGCGYLGYHGEHKGAYTLVYSQVPDILGGREVVAIHDPQVLLLEEDSFDRGLYLYYEDSDGMLTAAIVQRETKDFVYYYPEESTLSFTIPDSMFDIDNPELSEERLKSLFDEFCTDEALTQFKAQNDWDLSINEQKLEKAPITSPMLIYRWSHRGDGITVNLQESDWTEVMTEVAIQNGHEITDDNKYTVYLSYVSWMADDDYGRSLYYVDGRYYVYGDNEDDNISHRCYYLEMVAITDPDGSFDPDTFMMELTDKANYQSVIKELKQLHGWNEPLEEVGE